MDELRAPSSIEDDLIRLMRTWLENPGDASIVFELGVAHQMRSNLAQSIHCYEIALTVAPQMFEALANQSAALKELGHFELALSRLQLAIQIRPHDAAINNNLGAVLVCLGRHQEAIDCYSKALELLPNYEEALINKGFAHGELMQIEDAIQAYQEVLTHNPSSLQAQFNLSLMMLLLGHEEQGWLLYEARLDLPKNAHSYSWRFSGLPSWSGFESIQDRVLWVHSEQGFGDTLQFCREVLSLIELGANVVLSVPKALVTVVSTLEQNLSQAKDRARLSVVCEDEPVDHADYQIALMSLPLALMRQRELMSFAPRGVPYLFADDLKHREFDRVLGPKTAPRVALVWSGGHRAELPSSWMLNERRNIPLLALGDLRQLNVEWYSLQIGPLAQSDLVSLNAHPGFKGVRDLSPWIEDFSDTAAFVSHMDLVITVDTSMAHLVGALGKPVWILNRFDTCWRWGCSGDSSPWYASARLFRQPKAGDWGNVVLGVMKAFDTLLSK